jgi:WS/DGAT/MGAT family acyltransferase
MSALDASFLYVEEDGVSHMHVGSVGIFDGPVPTQDEFDRFVAGRLALVPRYRQRVRFVPGGLGRPVWVDDPHFNLAYHVRHTALAQPGGEPELRALVGRLMSQRLDRHKPLWELWKVEGLEDGHWALVNKIHHCMVDGVAGTDLLTVVLERSPDPAPPVPDDWRPAPEPSDLELVAGVVGELLADPREAWQTLTHAVGRVRHAAQTARDVSEGLANSLASVARPLAATSLDGPIGPHRRWAWSRADLDDVKAIRGALGGTVNDVVLAAITGGFRSLLLARGERCEGHVVRSLVPVSVRRPDERGAYDNRVSAVFAELPVGVADPVERLASIRAQMNHLKATHGAVAGEVLTSLAGFAPPMLLALGARVAGRLPQRNINTVTTNVPGPQEPLYVLGRPMVEVFPYVPIQGQVRIGVAVFSYVGRLAFGVTGDFDTAADITVLATGIEDGLAELLKGVEPA